MRQLLLGLLAAAFALGASPGGSRGQTINAAHYGHGNIIIKPFEAGGTFTFPSQPFFVDTLAENALFPDPTPGEWAGTSAPISSAQLSVETAYQDFLAAKRLMDGMDNGAPPRFPPQKDDGGNPDTFISALQAITLLNGSIAVRDGAWPRLYRGLAHSRVRAFDLAIQDLGIARQGFDRSNQVPNRRLSEEAARAAAAWAAGGNERAAIHPRVGTCPQTPGKEAAALGEAMDFCTLVFCGKQLETQTPKERGRVFLEALDQELAVRKSPSGGSSDRRSLLFCAANIKNIEADTRFDINGRLISVRDDSMVEPLFVHLFSSMEDHLLAKGEAAAALDLFKRHREHLTTKASAAQIALYYLMKKEVSGRWFGARLGLLQLSERDRKMFEQAKARGEALNNRLASLGKRLEARIRAVSRGNRFVTADIIFGKFQPGLFETFLAEFSDPESGFAERFFGESMILLAGLVDAIGGGAVTRQDEKALLDYEQSLSAILSMEQMPAELRRFSTQWLKVRAPIGKLITEPLKSIFGDNGAAAQRLQSFFQYYIHMSLASQAMLDVDRPEDEGRLLPVGTPNPLLDEKFLEILATVFTNPTDGNLLAANQYLTQSVVGQLSALPGALKVLPRMSAVMQNCDLLSDNAASPGRRPSLRCRSALTDAAYGLGEFVAELTTNESPPLADEIRRLSEQVYVKMRAEIGRPTDLDKVFLSAWINAVNDSVTAPGFSGKDRVVRLFLSSASIALRPAKDIDGRRTAFRHLAGQIGTIGSTDLEMAAAAVIIAAPLILPEADASRLVSQIWPGSRLLDIKSPVALGMLMASPTIVSSIPPDELRALFEGARKFRFHDNPALIEAITGILLWVDMAGGRPRLSLEQIAALPPSTGGRAIAASVAWPISTSLANLISHLQPEAEILAQNIDKYEIAYAAQSRASKGRLPRTAIAQVYVTAPTQPRALAAIRAAGAGGRWAYLKAVLDTTGHRLRTETGNRSQTLTEYAAAAAAIVLSPRSPPAVARNSATSAVNALVRRREFRTLTIPVYRDVLTAAMVLANEQQATRRKNGNINKYIDEQVSEKIVELLVDSEISTIIDEITKDDQRANIAQGNDIFYTTTIDFYRYLGDGAKSRRAAALFACSMEKEDCASIVEQFLNSPTLEKGFSAKPAALR